MTITKRLQHTQVQVCPERKKDLTNAHAQYSVSVFKNAATDTNKAVTSKPSNIVVLRNLPGKFKCNQDEAQTSVCTSHFSR